ncbi:MAG: hypothetical protein GXN95_03665 [Methanococci archaeon]|uniref:Uncharacterized protein n=1 Tax=Methanocaldococcus vulcanius (strain ATCC 700851 / DSM 12094 / M7) TaxID=579137 RepID=C9RI28_METVM|nr:hypothetical protein [Methanocaldococcus vulcanius]ACX73230.1 hypothetical protein Metvu_1377 [Methanocaldococcus vulcanius M7]NPA62634.1 hypothetical protein [Methanococci archaeon]
MVSTEKIAVLLCVGAILVIGSLFYHYLIDTYLSFQNQINTTVATHLATIH